MPLNGDINFVRIVNIGMLQTVLLETESLENFVKLVYAFQQTTDQLLVIF